MAAFSLRLDLAKGVNLHFLENEKRLPIIFFCCFELINQFLFEKLIWTNSQCRTRNNHRKCDFSKQS